MAVIEVVGRYRIQRLTVSVQEILRSKRLSQLALCLKAADGPSQQPKEAVEVPFSTSPVQQMYLALAPGQRPASTRVSFCG
jgi:hypothetical protein